MKQKTLQENQNGIVYDKLTLVSKKSRHNMSHLDDLPKIGSILTIRHRCLEGRDEDEQMLLEKAFDYQIPFNPFIEDLSELEAELEQWELLLEHAHAIGIDWDESYYDQLGLEEAIVKYQRAEDQEIRDLSEARHCYLASQI